MDTNSDHAHTWRTLARSCYGLAAASFVAIMQFASSPQVSVIHLCELVVAIPLLIAAAQTFDSLGWASIPTGLLSGKLTRLLFYVAAALSIVGLNGVLGAFHKALAVSLTVGIVTALLSYGLITWSFFTTTAKLAKNQKK